MPMPLPPLLQSIVDYLRKGYPQGVPERDYLPLFALLRRRLTDEEVVSIADELAAETSDETTSPAIRAVIEQLIREAPAEADVERVRAQLAAVGGEAPIAISPVR
jgi:hypothetical protein